MRRPLAAAAALLAGIFAAGCGTTDAPLAPAGPSDRAFLELISAGTAPRPTG